MYYRAVLNLVCSRRRRACTASTAVYIHCWRHVISVQLQCAASVSIRVLHPQDVTATRRQHCWNHGAEFPHSQRYGRGGRLGFSDAGAATGCPTTIGASQPCAHIPKFTRCTTRPGSGCAWACAWAWAWASSIQCWCPSRRERFPPCRTRWHGAWATV
jgi:hypothetical protein